MKKRATALTLAAALISGCSGSNHLLPPMPGSAPAAVVPDSSDPSGSSNVEALMRIRIPRRSERRAEMRPSTISPMTRSVAIAVNSAKVQVFNTTPSSAGCTAGNAGTTCTFAVHAPSGTDRFTVTTYSGSNANGTALDRGITALIPIKKGKANKISVSLGPVVTNAANAGTGSLRYAVASANSGDTITFLLPKGATIKLSSPIVMTGTLIIAGPGSGDLSISGGGAHQLFQVAGTATIAGLTLEHGKAAVVASPGGAILNMGTLILSQDTFGTNTSTVAIRRAGARIPTPRIHGLHPHCTTTTTEGGAIYNNGSLIMSNTIFSGNVMQSDIASCFQAEGGAIYNDIAGTVTSSNDTYTNNSAALGGAVYNGAAGAATFSSDTFTGNYTCAAASGCPTLGCSATSCTSHATGEGGAIYDAGVGITVTSSTFTGNFAGGKTPASQGAGGAIALDSVLPTITNDTFTGNLAGGGTSSCSAGEGGAIFAANALEIDGDTFKDNAATGDQTSLGGAVVGLANVSGTGNTFAGNKAVGSGGSCTTSATGAGGGLYSAATVTMSNSAFNGNSASGGANGLGGALVANEALLTNGTFSSNAVLATGAGGAGSAEAIGGAVSAQTVAKIAGSTFTSNSTTAKSSVAQAAVGGAVMVSAGSLISNGNTFTSNAAILKGVAHTAAGGAIAVQTGILASTGDKFTSNSATSAGTAGGGAVFAANGALLSNATLTSNKAIGATATGGAMILGGSSGSGQLKHVIVTGNSASGTTAAEGGALADVSGALILDSALSQNSATSAGGAIFSDQYPETIAQSTINGNTVTKAAGAGMGGGGINDNKGVLLSQTTIAGNSVAVSGPGPAGGGGILSADGIEMFSSTVSGNKVTGAVPSGGGGGIITGNDVEAINSTISNNSSSVDGGGFYNDGNTGITLGNVTLYQNSASGKGGNVYNYSGETMTLTNSVVGGGKAASGADIYNGGTITSGDYNIIATAPVGAALTGTTTHDLTTNPKLLPLSNNGGPAFTNADQATSPGKQHIPFATSQCNGITVPQDERGFTRGAGGRCDAGAYEYMGVATSIMHRPLPKPGIRHGAGAFPTLHIAVPRVKVIRL